MVTEPSEELGLLQELSLCPGLGLAILALDFSHALQGLLSVEERERREDSFGIAHLELVNLE